MDPDVINLFKYRALLQTDLSDNTIPSFLAHIFLGFLPILIDKLISTWLQVSRTPSTT